MIVCYTAVFSVVTGGALRDDTKNGCVADYRVEGRNWVVSDKTYDMQPTVKITSKLEDVAGVYHLFLFVIRL